VHRLLARQLKRLGLDADAAPPAEAWAAFLAVVGGTYAEQEDDRRLDQRSLDVAYREMDALNDKLGRSESRFRALASLSSDWLWEFDRDFRITEMVPAGPEDAATDAGIVGRRLWELPGSTLLGGGWSGFQGLLARHEPFTNVVYRYTLPDSRVRYVAASGEPVFDDAETFLGYRGVARDVTSEKVSEECIQRLATYDALTGLLNRTMLPQRLEQRLALARATSLPLSAFFIDLDRFKQINDRFGHAAGDAVLRETAERLRANTRGDDIVARLGGDEFLIITSAVTPHDVEALTTRLLAALAEPIVFEARELRVSGSIGVCRFPDDGGESGLLLQRADQAMYASKAAGGNAARRYDTDDHARIP